MRRSPRNLAVVSLAKRTTAVISLAALGMSFFPAALAQPAPTAVSTGIAAATTSDVSSQTTNPFPDVVSSYVNADAIATLKKQGVISGYPDGNYHPADDMNRAEFLKIVMGALDPNPKGSNCFSDVKNDWYAPYVCEAKAKGLISGYADGTFKPSSKINFGEAAKIMTNAFASNVTATTAASDQHWFKPYVETLASKKAIPLSVEFFDGNVKRDAMAEMIYRLKDNVTTKATRTYDEVVGDNFVTVPTCIDLKQRLDEQNAYINANPNDDLRGGMIEEPILGVGAPVPATPTHATGETTTSNMVPPAADQAMQGGAKTSDGASTDFSTTNVQVNGVDEGDVIKNDGKYIYIIKDGTLRIVEAYPATNLKELVSFTLGDAGETFTPSEMYVDGNTLTVIGSDYRQPVVTPDATTTSSGSVTPIGTTTTVAPDAKMMAPDYYPYYNYNKTKVFVIDITDRTKPNVKRSVEFDGSFNTSRKIDGTLYMVMNYNYSPIIYYAQPMPMVQDSAAGSTGSAGTPTTTSASIKAPTESEAGNAVVPKMLDTKNGTEQLVAPCSQIRILPKENNFNYLITAAVPLNDMTKDVSRSVIVGASDNIYASQNNLYVAAQDWGQGFYKPYGTFDTSVYKFALGNGTVEYKTKGTVPGQLLNQFSMDESNGYFRAATTKNEYTQGSEINNNVYVLDSNMKLAGKVENIAPGEKLYSARFMGDRAYLVTFNRIDPFFVLDLSSPTNPKITGKLKIPGYSDYLQPYDATHILGFGHDVDPTKVLPEDSAFEPGFITYDAMKGYKISLFDVSDIANPKEMFKQIIGDQGTTSPVSNDHKALLFDKAKGILALPITVYGFPTETNVCSAKTYSTCPTSCQAVCVPSSCTVSNGIKVCSADCDGANSCVQTNTDYSKPIFDGAYVYNINLTSGITLKGKVSHYTTDEQATLSTNGYPDYTKTIQRLLYIGESLYSVSPSEVMANTLTDLTQQGMIKLAGSAQQVYYGKPMPL